MARAGGPIATILPAMSRQSVAANCRPSRTKSSRLSKRAKKKFSSASACSVALMPLNWQANRETQFWSASKSYALKAS
jgi:hypothetical protein